MPDIRELPEHSRLDVAEPFRVYELLPPVHKDDKIRRRVYKRSASSASSGLFGSGGGLPTLSQNLSGFGQQLVANEAFQRGGASASTVLPQGASNGQISANMAGGTGPATPPA